MIKLTFELEDAVMTAVPSTVIGGDAGSRWIVTLDVTKQYLSDFINGAFHLPPDAKCPQTVEFEVTDDQLASLTALAIGVGEQEATIWDVTALYAQAEAALPPDLHRDLRPIP